VIREPSGSLIVGDQMTIDVSPETVARLEEKARAEGISVEAYVRRLVSEADSRQARLNAFRQEIENG
jgi:predicted HicB family RNase H-like nuclease